MRKPHRTLRDTGDSTRLASWYHASKGSGRTLRLVITAIRREAVRVDSIPPVLSWRFYESDPLGSIDIRTLRTGLGGRRESRPVGTWKCQYEIEGQTRTSTLTVKKDEDNLTGTMSWPDQKAEPLNDLKLKDGTLTFDAKRVFMGQEFANHYELKIDEDKLKGKLTSDLMGKKYDFDLEATRER